MMADKPSRLVPKLRFPEFWEEAAWSARTLTDVVRSISSGLNLTQTNGSNGFRVTRIETIADGTVDINKVGLVTTDQDISSYRLNVGDILLSNINSIAHIGKSVLIDRDYDLYHGMNLLRLKALFAVIDPLFLFYWLNTEITRASIRSRANKAVNQASINRTELGNTIVLLPLLTEQQKIADCLGSLDDLIAAEGRKIDALRQHKQGLMQQLFPQPGKTVPRLRFPEFSKEGAWEETTIGNMGEIITGSTPSTSRRDFYGGDFMFVSPADISDLRFVEETKTTLTEAGFAECRPIKKNSVLFVCIGSIGKVAQCLRPCATNQQINSLIVGPAFVADFAYYLLNRESVRIASLAGRQVMPIINKSLFATVKVTAPAFAEQQRIADCLGSLDNLIAVEGQKLDALRQHKQGLMQQLFPSPDGQ